MNVHSAFALLSSRAVLKIGRAQARALAAVIVCIANQLTAIRADIHFVFTYKSFVCDSSLYIYLYALCIYVYNKLRQNTMLNVNK